MTDSKYRAAKDDGRVGGGHRQQGDGPVIMVGAGKFWVMPFVKKVHWLGDRYKRSGKCEAGMNTWKEGTNSWLKERHGYRS